jgi:Ion channel
MAPSTHPRPHRPSLHVRHVALVRRSGMAVLLVFLLSAIFVIPAFFHRDSVHNNDVVVALILVGGMIAVAEYHKIAITLLVLTVCFLGLRLEGVALISSPIYRDVLILGSLVLLTVAVGLSVFGRGHAVSDRVFGAVVLYLLLGIVWAIGYALVYREVPHAFAGQLDQPETFGDWAYFSLVTLTTLGYGDITPVARLAHSLATLEGLIGQLYPAIIIARLLALPNSNAP